MAKFKIKPLRFERNQDEGITVSELIGLVGDNPIGAELLKKMNVDSIKEEFINIPNAKAIFTAQKAINNKYHKEDLESSLDDISLYSESGEFSINFGNLERSDYFHLLGIQEINTAPIYSAQADFFSNLCQMDRYAASLIKRGYREIVEMNYEQLREKISFTKKYRILHHKKENLFYLRAITSTNQYHNYDNNITIIVALLTLHNEMKVGNVKFRLVSVEYSESVVRMFFESSERNFLDGVGYVRNFIDVSNDEIKREALRFSGSCMIEFTDEHNNKAGLFIIPPKEISSRILSIRHNARPETAYRELASIANSKKIHDDLFNDILTIKNIKNPETIKLMLRRKIDRARSEEIGNKKTEILKILDQPASNILQLLNIFRKVEIFAQEDVGVTEYLRLAIYEILIKRRSR